MRPAEEPKSVRFVIAKVSPALIFAVSFFLVYPICPRSKYFIHRLTYDVNCRRAFKLPESAVEHIL